MTEKKRKKTISCMGILLYCIITIWIAAWLYNNKLQPEYEFAFWATIAIHYLFVYFAGAITLFIED